MDGMIVSFVVNSHGGFAVCVLDKIVEKCWQRECGESVTDNASAYVKAGKSCNRSLLLDPWIYTACLIFCLMSFYYKVSREVARS